MNYRCNLKTKVFAWFLSFCLVITLIPDIGLAQTSDEEALRSESHTETIRSDVITEADIIEKTEDTTTYVDEEGIAKTIFHGGDVRFEDSDGNLIDYDPSLVEVTEQDEISGFEIEEYSFRTKAGDKVNFIPEKLSENTPVVMKNNEYQITFVPQNEVVQDAEIADFTATREEVTVPSIYDGEETLNVNAVFGSENSKSVFTYTSGEHGIKETITLNERPDTNIIRYMINVGELDIRENSTNEGLTIYDGEDIVAGIEVPWMNDTSGEAYSEDITYDLQSTDDSGIFELIMTISSEYLDSEDREYPVTVDPTINWTGNDKIRDVFVRSDSYANTCFYDSSTTVIAVGTNSNGRHRTYMKLLNLKEHIISNSIKNASITLYETGNGAANQNIRINWVTEEFNATTLTWNTIPPYYSDGYVSQKTTTNTANTPMVFGLAPYIKKVADGSLHNYGLVFRNMTTDPVYTTFYGSRSTLTSYRPKLVIEYYSVPTKATSASMELKSGATGTKSGTSVYVQNSTQTVINYAGIESDGLKRVEHRIWTYDENNNTIGDIVVDYGASSAITSGGTTPALSEGCYRVNIRGVNVADDTGPFRIAGHVHVDTTVPAVSSFTTTPATTSSSGSTNTNPTIKWNVTDKHLNNIAVSIDGQQIYSTSASGAGECTVPNGYIKNPGSYEISLTATDKAGNSVTRTINYYIKSAGARITDISVDPEGTGAQPSNKQDPTVSWTIAGEEVEEITLEVNGEPVNDSNIDVDTRSYKLSKSLLPVSGEYVIKVIVTDVRRRSTDKTVNYNLDIEKPTIDEKSTIPETGLLNTSNNRSPKLKWYIEDPDFANIQYSMDQSTWHLLGTTQSGEVVMPSSAWTSSSGKQTIYIKAVDKAGNESSVNAVDYYLGNGGSYAPQNMSVSEYYGKRILTWQLDAYDESFIKFDIHRGTTAGFTPGDSTLVESNVTGGDLHYIDNDILAAGTYYYCIVVRDTTGSMSSITSNQVSYTNSITEAAFVNTAGSKDYLSYTTVGIPTGTVNVEESSGNLMFDQTDFEISNPQLDYSMVRTYNSKLPFTSMLGEGWMDSYHKEIYDCGNSIYLLESDGSIYEFTQSNGVYRSNELLSYTINKATDGYTAVTTDNVTYTFNSSGQLVETTEPNGCSIENVYDSEGRLISVISSSSEAASKALKFEYSDGSRLLDHVNDLVGTAYTYTYAGKDLTKLTVSSGSDSVVYNYGYGSTSGKLEIITDAMGNNYHVAYSSGKVSSCSYPDGEKLTFTYSSGKTDIKKFAPANTGITDAIFEESTTFDTATGRIVSHTDPAGSTTTYSYMSSNPYLQASQTYPVGYVTVSNGVMTIGSQNQTDTINTYTANGDVSKETEGDGTVTEYTYNSNDDLTKEVAVNGSVTVTNTSYTYDADQNVETVTDNVQNTKETYTYNGDGQETNVVETDENVTVSETELTYDSEGNNDTSKQYAGDMLDEISDADFDEMGRVLRTVQNGITTENEYDFLGRLTRTTKIESGKSNIVTTYSYNANGSLMSESESGGVTKAYSYDSRNRVVNETVSGSGMDTRRKTTSYGYTASITVEDGISSRTEKGVYVETVKDTAENTVSQQYIDKSGNLIKEVAGNSIVYYTYDKSDNQVVTYRKSSSDTSSELTVRAHDKQGNVIAEISSPGISGSSYTVAAGSVAVFRTYDVKGNLLNERNKETVTGSDIITAYTYDSQDRITSVNVGNDNVIDVSAAYSVSNSGTVTTVTDANGNQKLTRSDEYENVLSTRDVDSSNGDNIFVRYKYDTLGRKTEEEYVDGSKIKYTYEGTSERVSTEKAYIGTALKSQEIYAYTGYGLLSSITCKDGSGNIYCTTEYTYDAEGKILTESVTYAGSVKQTITSEYDAEGRLDKVTYPSSTGLGTVSYTYNSRGLVTEISNSAGTVREYTYDGLDRIAAVKDYDKPGAGTYIHKAYTYDSHGRVLSMTYRDNGASGTVLESFVYTYKANSNDIATIAHVNNLPGADSKINETRSYTYDSHGNLTQSIRTDHLNSNAAVTTNYTYDPVGNRLTKSVGNNVTSYVYNGLNQLVSTNHNGTKSAEYAYDERGNQIEEADLLKDQTTVMSYSPAGEMISLVTSNDTAEIVSQQNVYNHNGQRISRTQDGVKREYYYDRGVAAFTTDAGSISSANVLDAEGDAVGTYRGSVYYNYLKDGQASTTSIVKEDGTLSAAYEYSDFGETEEITGSSFDNQICYTGGIYDEETGLYYLNARYYDPAIGRFISQDSYRGELDTPGQWHLYAYCANNPINYVDPSGHLILAIPIAAGTVFTVKAITDGLLIIGMIIVAGEIYNEYKYKRNSGYSVKLEMDKPQKYKGKTGFASMQARWKDMKGTKVDKIKKFAKRKNHNWRYHVHARIMKNGKTIKRVLIV